MSDTGVSYNDAPTEGTEEVVIPAPCAVSIYTGVITAGGEIDDIDRRLLVGWNSAGSPIVVGDNGALRLLEPGEAVTALEWSD